MASAARTFTRALRASSTPRLAVARSAFRQQARRGYADSASPKSGGNGLLIGGLAVVGLGGAYYAFNNGAKSSAAGTSKVFQPTQEDYQKVYDAVAKRLVEHDDYDDGSYGPVLLRLGWHASGTYDEVRQEQGTHLWKIHHS